MESDFNYGYWFISKTVHYCRKLKINFHYKETDQGRFKDHSGRKVIQRRILDIGQQSNMSNRLLADTSDLLIKSIGLAE